jgi:iron-sulfur cluster repair protein YtfE (RIC family)
MSDPVHELAHDHADLNRRVLALASLINQRDVHSAAALLAPLGELRELLFLHFAREEEGLFPFVAEAVGELAERVHEMAFAHDAICGALARMYHLAASGSDPSSIATLYERFEQAYSKHAQAEGELLRKLDAILDADQRARLATLVEGL